MPLVGDAKREYQRKWLADRRKKWFDTNGPCKNCGSANNLELHHLDPKLKISHKIWSWSWKRIEEETAKCIILCEDCHAIETSKQREIPLWPHGHNYRYVDKRTMCRCDLCKEAHRIYNREIKSKGR